MVEYTDGSTIAQLSLPDMRLPIGYALAWPDRIDTPFGAIDWARVGSLDFTAPDHEAFPCLGLAYEAARIGGTAPAWLNAANEVAVAAFLEGRIAWTAIPDTIAAVLELHDGTPAADVNVIVAADNEARERARMIIEQKASAA
jgi:1-deoxy-D-xylulose-5-phosphate reductoisomerase